MLTESRQYLPSLEGIRALAFILVFTVHLSGDTWTLSNRTIWAWPWLLACQLSFCAVPIFFTLSGFLITRLLLGSLERPGFFRVFYCRRALRVLPLYYLILVAIFVTRSAMGIHFLWRYALLFTYLNNLWPHSSYYNLSPNLYIGHFWSLAVEEQFYILWPLAVWFVRDRRKLLWLCGAVIAASFVARVTAPLLRFGSDEFAYGNTIYRCDSIMLGCALCLYQEKVGNLRRLAKPSAIALLLCSAVIVIRALAVGQAMPFENFGVVVIMPLLSIMGASIVVLTLTPGSWLERASTRPWAIYLGKRSYSLYLLHMLIVHYFLSVVIPRLTDTLGRGFGRITGMGLAFILTCLAAEVTYRYVEEPAMKLKKYVPNGKPGALGWGLPLWSRDQTNMYGAVTPRNPLTRMEV